MEQFFNLIISSTVTAFAVLLIKALFSKKISPKWHVYIWAILAARLLIPVLPESSFSIFNNTPAIRNVEMSDMPLNSKPRSQESYVVGEVVLSDQSKPFILHQSVYDKIAVIWGIGAVTLFLYLLTVYFLFGRKIKQYPIITETEILQVLNKCKRSTGVSKSIVIRRGGSTPLLKGIVNPELILPEGYSADELESIFTHELMHLKYNDISVLMFCTLLLCLYWYNPVLWICFFALRRDIEVLCDYRVLEILQDRKQYASVLLKTALKKNNFLIATTSMQNGAKEIRRRIKFIACYKKPKVIWSTAAILAVLVIGIFCLTNARESSKNIINGYDVSSIYRYKTKYVGDASKVNGLADNLPYSQYKNGISLQTKSEPYGLTVNYTVTPDESSKISSDEGNTLIKNAAVLFAMIGNVDIVRYRFDDGTNIVTYTYKREELAKTYGHDFKVFSSSLIKFRDEFIPSLSSVDWNGIEKVNLPVSITKNIELYVWRNKKLTGNDDLYYTFVPYKNKVSDSKTIYNTDIATKDIDKINERLKAYEGETYLSIRHDASLTKNEMLAVSESIHFPGSSISIGFVEESDISGRVETRLESIMSSPKEASNPEAYINAHRNEYEEILKMGDDALSYMLSQFGEGRADGLKGQIMMSLCKEILGDRNNVKEGSYLTPTEWYKKLAPYTAKELSDLLPEAKDKTEELVYKAALEKYKNSASMTIVAPHIFGATENNNELKIFATVYYGSYNLYGNTLSQSGAGVVPAAIIYTKNSEGAYILKDYIEAKDGSYFQKSIQEFCAPRSDIAKAIVKHYSNYQDLREKMKRNVILCLTQNKLTGVSLKDYDGTLTPLT
ncbi:MAG: DUF4825 domain-containing protein [Clostridiales bacterium]|nr:DUF4825 domain-containing protein [Clostridiales bacterium]